MPAWFVHGALCDDGVRRVVLGREVGGLPADLPDHAVILPAGGAFGVLVARAGGTARGLVLRGLAGEEQDRLRFFAGPEQPVTVRAAGADLDVVTGAFATTDGPDWDSTAWQARWAKIALATAQDIMALWGRHPGEAVRARLGPLLVRGASRVRAARAQPDVLRGTAQGLSVADRRMPYANFFAVEEYDLSFRRFDGTMSPLVTRAAFISGDAVTVLPYDPVRDRVLLIEQFRAGPYARGDAQPWQLEAIAGRIDPGETPPEAARREAEEEAGLQLGALLPVAGYYPSPGAKSEFLYSYLALADLPDDAAGVFGVAGEAEDIRGHLVSFEALMALVASGEASSAPLILSALWLQRERPTLRG